MENSADFKSKEFISKRKKKMRWNTIALYGTKTKTSWKTVSQGNLAFDNVLAKLIFFSKFNWNSLFKRIYISHKSLKQWVKFRTNPVSISIEIITKGQLPVVKLVTYLIQLKLVPYLIQTLDKHSALLLLHKRIIHFSFSVQMKGSYSRLRMFQDFFHGYRWEETDSYFKIWFYNCWWGYTFFFTYWSPLTETQKDLRSEGCLSIIKLQLS